MAYNCVVLVKQVPDTQAVTGKAMKDDGTVNRAALPAIFNPEDLNALELALQIKDRYGGTVTVMTMGLPKASEVLREGLYRGADRAILITDRRAAASDTLATSYILCCAIKKLPETDVVLCGRQAIDGDTAQVGPQVAEKLDMTQITYVEQLEQLQERQIICRRNLGAGWERVQAQLPVVLTVIESANEPRPCGVKRIMRHKKSRSPSELKRSGADEAQIATLQEKGLVMEQWDLDTVEADLQWCGKDGSPTKVHRVQSVVLTATGYKDIEPTEEVVRQFVHELIEDHTIG